jgi:hypothetical protein
MLTEQSLQEALAAPVVAETELLLGVKLGRTRFLPAVTTEQTPMAKSESTQEMPAMTPMKSDVMAAAAQAAAAVPPVVHKECWNTVQRACPSGLVTEAIQVQTPQLITLD